MTPWMKLLVCRSIQARLFPALRSPKMRAHIKGVSVRDTRPVARMATLMETENSRKMRPRSPGMKTNGMKTAANEMVIDRIAKEISDALVKVALRFMY